MEENMDLNDFIIKFVEQFDETDANEFKAETRFKELDEWSSMLILAIIAMITNEYGVTIKGADIRRSETIGDLFNIVREYKI
jgi:acyl carrier protein